MFYIQRHTEKIIEKIGQKKGVIVVTGARQVGKSTMLKMRFPEYEYINLDKPSIREELSESPSSFLEIHNGNLIIDEIQKSPSFFEYIKENIDEVNFERLKNGKNEFEAKFILTGSQTFHLMKNVTESLAGRTGIIQMCGLSKREINQSDFTEPFLPTSEQLKQKQTNKIVYDYKKIIEIIHKGSFPELYQTNIDLSEWQNFYDSYIKTYLEKDVREIINVQNETAFIKFLRAVAARTGQQLNLTALAEVVGKDVNTMKSWLSVLQTSGLVYLLEPYYNNFNKRLTKTPKLYMLDTGLACFLGGWNTPEQLTNGAMWGQIFETWVIGEIIKSYYNSGITLLPIYYYRDKEKREIDLIIEEAGTLFPVEIKTTSDPNKSMIAAFELLKKIPDKNLGEGAVICLAKEILPLSGGNWIVPVDMI
jgi:predicted AAA+ superfamily ATPase